MQSSCVRLTCGDTTVSLVGTRTLFNVEESFIFSNPFSTTLEITAKELSCHHLITTPQALATALRRAVIVLKNEGSMDSRVENDIRDFYMNIKMFDNEATEFLAAHIKGTRPGYALLKEMKVNEDKITIKLISKVKPGTTFRVTFSIKGNQYKTTFVASNGPLTFNGLRYDKIKNTLSLVRQVRDWKEYACKQKPGSVLIKAVAGELIDYLNENEEAFNELFNDLNARTVFKEGKPK